MTLVYHIESIYKRIYSLKMIELMLQLRNGMKQTIITALLALVFGMLGTQANASDIIKGRVLDAETHEPLEGVRVEVTEVIPDVATMIQVLSTDSLGCFQFLCTEMARITLRANFFGYKQGIVRMRGSDTGDTVRIDDILLQPSEILLKEVTVSASQRRFYMRGDTVVFNPDAFQMEDGDRLLDLIQKLPGVSIKEGRLLWNGEPLKIMMNGKEALSEDMLLNHLPVEAVADIKAYERKSEQEERTGVADGNQQQVLDVTIKPGFLDKWYGYIETEGYTSKHYGAKLNGMKLSDTDPMMIFGKVGDEPEKVRTLTMGSRSGTTTPEATRQQIGAVGYRHAWQPSFEVKRESYLTLTAGANHTDQPQSSWQNTQTFLPGTTPTQTNSQQSNYEHQFKVPIDFSAFLNLNSKSTLFLTANARYEQGETDTHKEQETFESLTLAPINTSTFRSSSLSKMFTGSINGELTHYTPKGSIQASASVNYSNTKEHGNSVGEYHYYQTDALTTDRQNYEAPHRHLNAAAQLGLNHALTKQVMFHAQWQTAYDHNFRDEQRLRANMIDPNNSFHRTDNQWNNELSTDANLTLQKLTLRPAFALTHRHEQTDYRRAALDTVARRNLLLLRPSLELTYRIRKQMNLKGDLSYDERPADLIDCIAYTDDTNPLYIFQGNPSLKTSHTLNAGLRYNFMLTRGSQAFGIAVNYTKAYDPIGTVLHYNSQTGVYRAQKQNVRGGNSWGAELNYDRSLAQNWQLANTLSERWNASYGILTMVDEQTGLSYNRQNFSHLRERLGLTYEMDSWVVTSSFNFDWEHYAYSDAAQKSENIFCYATNLHVRYNLDHWSFSLSPNFYVNRGYLSDAMNNNQFILHAQINYKFLKKRANLTLSVRDLLNQETTDRSVITATTHTESGESFLHHYAVLTFRYTLEAKKK